MNPLKQEIFDLITKYYSIHHKPDPFIPGTSPIPYAGRVYDEKEMISLVDSALDFWLTAGHFANKFETDFAKFTGAKHCSLTNSGSSANLLAMSALTSPSLGKRQLVPGDQVITIAASFPTTITPIIQNNLVPVFIDIDPCTYNIQSHSIEAAITSKTKAIFIAHTLGNPFDLDTVTKIAKKYSLYLIEDCCDALGSTYRDQHVGTFGDIGTFSFYPPHHITMGEGGALITNNTQLKNIIESFRDWGRDCQCQPGQDNLCNQRFSQQHGQMPYGYDHKYIYSHLGYNLKITDMQASIGCAQLEKLPTFIASRKDNFKTLSNSLTPHSHYFTLPVPTPHSDPSWFGFMLTVNPLAPFTRNEIVSYLEAHHIATRMLFAGNITRQPLFKGIPHYTQPLPYTDEVMNNSFWIGVYPGLTSEMLNYIEKTFNDFIEMKETENVETHQCHTP